MHRGRNILMTQETKNNSILNPKLKITIGGVTFELDTSKTEMTLDLDTDTLYLENLNGTGTLELKVIKNENTQTNYKM